MSSRLAAILAARENKLDDLFVDCGLKEKPEQPQPPVAKSDRLREKDATTTGATTPTNTTTNTTEKLPKKKSSLSGSSSSSSGGSSI